MFDFADKLFFRKITSKSNQEKQINKDFEKCILDEIFYFFCGINTQNIRFYDESNISVNSELNNTDIVKKIRMISFQIRLFEKFIYENEYSSDSLRRIIACELDNQVINFQKHIVSIKSSITSIEEFFVKISYDIDLFEEFERIIQIISERNGDILINLLKERMDKMVQFNSFYNNLIEKFVFDINQRIYEFVNDGIIQMPFFMVKEKSTFNFNEKYIADKFFIEQSYVPFYIKNTKNIFEAGIYTNLLKEFKDFFSNSQYTKELLVNDNNPRFECIDKEIFEYKNLKAFANLIKNERDKKYQLLNQHTAEIFLLEWSNIQKYIFFHDQTFLYDIFHESNINTLSNDKNSIIKMNCALNNQNIKFEISKNTLMTYLSRILNIEIDYDLDEDLCVLDGLIIKYNPNKLFLLFLSEKTISELELIFRMFYSMQIINYCIIKEEKNKFTNLLLIINNYLISSFYTQQILKEILTISTHDMNQFIFRIENLVKIALRNLYLTSYEAFQILSQYFSICFKYIKYKKYDFENLRSVISRLSFVVDNENYNIFLANILYHMKETI